MNLRPRLLVASLLLVAAAGCATPAGVPDRSASTRPEPALDRPYGSPSESPTATGQGDGGFGASALRPPAGPPGFNGTPR